MKDLVTSNDTMMSLSFFLLNRIISKSDGALSEIVGKYCVEYFALHPKFILTYFNKEKAVNVKQPLLKAYAGFVGYELYFKREGTSKLKYSYESFKEILNSASQNNKETEETFKVFWKLVDETIKNMN